MTTGWTKVSLALVDIGIQELSKISPMMVLVLGDLRYCESRRAEAIMSVVG
jgi:hypothetical protein